MAAIQSDVGVPKAPELSPLSPKRSLYVSLVRDSNQMVGLAEVASQWNTVAAKREKLPQSFAEKKQFEASKHIADAIKLRLKTGQGRGICVVVCRDFCLQEVQAIALYKLARCGNALSIEVDQLITNPDNIRSPLNRLSVTRVEGAATKILRYIANIAQRQKRVISLDAGSEAVRFYQKLGFEYVEPEILAHLPNAQGDKMVLKEKALQAFLHSD